MPTPAPPASGNQVSTVVATLNASLMAVTSAAAQALSEAGLSSPGFTMAMPAASEARAAAATIAAQAAAATPAAITATSGATESGPPASVTQIDTGAPLFAAVSPMAAVTPPTGSSGPAQAAAPADSNDRALSAVAQPPPVKAVTHAQALPPKVKHPVIPGLVDQAVAPRVTKPGVPGVAQDFSSSGNIGRW